jgi:hypothetical protein
VVGTVSDPNYQGSSNGMLIISKALAGLTFTTLSATYDGTPKSAAAVTNPAGLEIDFTYNGSSVPPTDIGSYPLVANVNDPNYQGSASSVFVISLSAIQTWRNKEFGSDANNPLIAGDNATPAHDGIPNLLKYALGLDPFTAYASGVITQTDIAGGSLEMKVAKNPLATDVTLTVQVSGNLIDWTSNGTTVLVNNPSVLQVRDNTPVTGATKRFIRLQVTNP